MDWYEAVDYCESNFNNSYLADILDQETQDFIDDEYLQTYPFVSYWIGGNDITDVSHQRIHNSMFYYINGHCYKFATDHKKIARSMLAQ
jgi:hypothetical protein